MLRPGAAIALLDGRADIADRLFTLRLRMPEGYRIMPHWHPADEHVTVVSGALRVGHGRRSTSIRPGRSMRAATS